MVIRANNLMGDTLYSLKPLAEYHMQRPNEDVAVCVGNDLAGEMVRRQLGSTMRIVDSCGADAVDLSAGHAAKVAVDTLLRTNARLHISEAYAQILGIGVGWNGDCRPLTGWVRNRRKPDARRYVLISPFSRSCDRNAGRRANKTPDHERWGLTVDWIRSCGLEPVITRGPNDVWTGVHVRTVTTESLDQLVWNLTGATAVITVDNGIGHMASALGCRTAILWPPVSSVSFIAPTWSESTTLLYMRPERVRADQLRMMLQKELPL